MTLSEYHIDKPLDRRSNHKAQCVFVIVFWEHSKSDCVHKHSYFVSVSIVRRFDS